MSYELLSDLDLIEKIKKKNCEKSLHELIKRHEDLFYKIFHNYIPIIEKKQIGVNDLLDEKNTLIYKAILSFNADKNTKFSTWLARCVKYRCLRLIYKKPNLVSYDQEELTQLIDSLNHIDNRHKDDIEFIFHIVSSIKDKRIKKIFHLRFFGPGNKNQSWSFVGQQLGISAQMAINLFNRGKQLILKKIKSENFLDKI